MLDSQALRRATSAVGLLFKGRAPDARTYLGSCFNLMAPTVFITAAHCVDGINLDELWLNHHGGPPPDLFTEARTVEMLRESDLAIITTDAPGARWATPFPLVRFWADLGEEVSAFGFPADLIADPPAKETPRFFRGIVQRPFLYTTSRTRYEAFELSFPCPPGLSGGPVFLSEHPAVVIGVVTTNFESYTTRYEEVQEISPGQVRTLDARSIITFGVASQILNAADALERVLGRPLEKPPAA